MSKTVLHENCYGIQMIREDYVKRSKVTVKSAGGYTLNVYRFDRIPATFDSPFVSWANLDCCNGWWYDKGYLVPAVLDGRKLYAGLYDQQLPETIPTDFIAGNEGFGLPGNMFICRRGKLSDYYDLDMVFSFYNELRLNLPCSVTEAVKEFSSCELSDFASAEKAPFHYANAAGVAQLITTGLLLGYPLESTCSIIQGY